MKDIQYVNLINIGVFQQAESFVRQATTFVYVGEVPSSYGVCFSIYTVLPYLHIVMVFNDKARNCDVNEGSRYYTRYSSVTCFLRNFFSDTFSNVLT